MKKRYYNLKINKYYNGGSMTYYIDNKLISGIPTEEHLKTLGYEEVEEPKPYVPTEEDNIRNQMYQIQNELSSMDYLTSKYIDGEDMTKYGDWQTKRRELREQYNQLEEQLNARGEN